MLSSILMGLYGALSDIFMLLGWRDILEISILFYALYSFLLWIGKDSQQPLLLYAYAYSGLIVLSYFLYLPVLYFLLLLFLPVCLVIFILLHQKTLQKNFISFHATKAPERDTQDNDEWKEIIIRAALIASNQKKNCFFVIERSNSLNDFLEIPYFLEVEINKEFFSFIIEASDATDHIFLISNKTIKSIHSRWKILYTKESLKLSTNESTALVLSENIDCIILYTQQNKPGLTIIAQGKLTQNLSAYQATTLLNQSFKNSMNNKAKDETKPL